MEKIIQAFSDKFGYPSLVSALKASESRHEKLLNFLAENPPTDITVRKALHEVYNPPKEKTTQAVLTGYYLPTIYGSLVRTAEFSTPIFKLPEDSHIKNLSREKIELSDLALDPKNVVAWTNDPISLFFLQIQGSGYLSLPNGERLHLRYAGNNGHEYRSIGSELIRSGVLPTQGISLELLKGYLYSNPQRASHVMRLNPRYTFFSLDSEPIVGSEGCRLIPFRSVAADPEYYPAHSLLIVKAHIPGAPGSTDNSGHALESTFLALSHDQGAAIKGVDKLDLFCGDTQEAEFIAGGLKSKATIWQLTERT